MSSLDDVWGQMKDKALAFARDGIVPVEEEAQRIVGGLLFSAHLDPRPTREVIEFYARELIALTRDEIDRDFV